MAADRLPVIGVPTQALSARDKPARFGIGQAYVRALEAAGAAPVLIPLLDDEARLRAISLRLDGILFPGGEDVSPREYGEEPIPDLSVGDPVRDGVELRLARWAMQDDLATLGICRGQQLLTVALGGSLFQDLRSQGVTTLEHSGKDGRQRGTLIHSVRLEPNSRLARLVDEAALEVNSLHHQAVRTVPAALSVVGRSPDGIIEAVEAPDRRFFVAVQWHPEELLVLPWARRLFVGFVQAAGAVARSRPRGS